MDSPAPCTALDMPAEPLRQARFRAPFHERFLWAHWEVDSVLFNGGTGDTHLLSPIPSEILDLLGDREMPFFEICADMASRCSVANDAIWQEKLARIISDLEQLDIIEARIDEA